MKITLDDLRRYAVARSLFAPMTLSGAMEKMGFVQADPIRAPARAQDLTLRHRVKDYRVGDLDRCYSKLGIAEDFFINYGFVTHSVQKLMHPRHRVVKSRTEQLIDPWHDARWSTAQRKRARDLLEFIRERGAVHPREVDEHFEHGRVKNWFGGSSNVTTRLLDAMHYGGLLRVVRRDGGTRVYAAHEHGPAPTDAAALKAQIDVLADIAVRIYAPLPSGSLTMVVGRLRFGVPQWRDEVASALRRAKERLAHTKVDDIEWYWPADEDPLSYEPSESVRLLTPFDPIVWDRDRFELLWGWSYRFEAYTPAAKRVRGYYALPLLWRDRVIGWGNLAAREGALISDLGYVAAAPRDRAFKRELAAELDRLRFFLRLE